MSCVCSPVCVASSRPRSCWWETDRSATRRSRQSIASSSDATSGFSARWTTSPKSCEAATCSCCRPRPSRSALRPSRRWRVPCRPSPAPWAGSPGSSGTARRASSHRRGTAGRWVAGGAVVGLGAAARVNGTAVLAGLAAFAVLVLYSPVLKRRGLPGNLAVALVAGLPLMYGAVAVGHAAAGIVPWILAAWIHLVREIVKDIDDQTGDRTLGRRTLPLVLGARRASLVAAGLAAAFVPLSLALPAGAHYHGAYFLIALCAQLVVLAVASRLFTGRTQGNSRLLKGAMLVGIVALVAGRVA